MQQPSPAKFLSLKENTKGRDFVVGDIHGAFDLLDQALLAVKFDPEKDRLFSVGDLIDRGDRSVDCLYYLAQPWFHAIRGNHEDMFISLFKNGRLDIEELRNNPNYPAMKWIEEQSDDTLNDIYAAFKELPIALEIRTSKGNIGIVHADVPQDMNWKKFKQKIEAGDKNTILYSLWSRERISNNDARGVKGVSHIFFGHSPVESGPAILGNCFFIDTGAVFKQIYKDKTNCAYLSIVNVHASKEDFANKKAIKNNSIVLIGTGNAMRKPSLDSRKTHKHPNA